MNKFKLGKNISFDKTSNKKSLWKNKQMLWIMAGFIIILMVGSILTLMFTDQSSSNAVEENGHKFFPDQNNNGWKTKVNGNEVSFAYLPSQLNDIKRDFLFLAPGKTYVTFNGNEFLENSQEINILTSFLTATGRTASPACTSVNGCGDLPLINCDTKLNDANIVYIYIGNETFETQQANCLKLSARPGDELRLINLFVYQLLGIVK